MTDGSPLSEALSIAFSGPIIRRGLKYAVVVGSILAAINHGDAILLGRLTPLSYLKIAVTLAVPYCVSVLSSVAAILDLRVGASSPAAVRRDLG